MASISDLSRKLADIDIADPELIWEAISGIMESVSVMNEKIKELELENEKKDLLIAKLSCKTP
ncbi:MAG: hypothetical protein ACFFD4_02375 [Candidatus Odinarchaeota archaeon]